MPRSDGSGSDSKLRCCRICELLLGEILRTCSCAEMSSSHFVDNGRTHLKTLWPCEREGKEEGSRGGGVRGKREMRTN